MNHYLLLLALPSLVYCGEQNQQRPQKSLQEILHNAQEAQQNIRARHSLTMEEIQQLTDQERRNYLEANEAKLRELDEQMDYLCAALRKLEQERTRYKYVRDILQDRQGKS